MVFNIHSRQVFNWTVGTTLSVPVIEGFHLNDRFHCTVIDASCQLNHEQELTKGSVDGQEFN